MTDQLNTYEELEEAGFAPNDIPNSRRWILLFPAVVVVVVPWLKIKGFAAFPFTLLEIWVAARAYLSLRKNPMPSYNRRRAAGLRILWRIVVTMLVVLSAVDLWNRSSLIPLLPKYELEPDRLVSWLMWFALVCLMAIRLIDALCEDLIRSTNRFLSNKGQYAAAFVTACAVMFSSGTPDQVRFFFERHSFESAKQTVEARCQKPTAPQPTLKGQALQDWSCAADGTVEFTVGDTGTYLGGTWGYIFSRSKPSNEQPNLAYSTIRELTPLASGWWRWADTGRYFE